MWENLYKKILQLMYNDYNFSGSECQIQLQSP